MSPLVLFSCLLVAAAASEASIQDTCPSQLATTNQFYLQVHKGVCYKFAVNQRKTFEEAQEECEQDGGTLAMPRDILTNDFLAKKTFEHYGAIDEMWIGLSDLGDENKYMWVDGSEMDWQHFAKGNGPTNNWLVRQLEDCVAMDPLDGYWHDFLCNDDIFAAGIGSEPRKPYICQFEADPNYDDTDNDTDDD